MTRVPVRSRIAAVRVGHAATVLTLSLSYLAYVFRLTGGSFWHLGLGDWMDPYFINALLEHWYHAAWTLANPASPPMYFPEPKTLGYSHGLVLYALFYVPLRFFLHPFRAYNLTLFAVMETGIVCLYLLLRKLKLSFAESLLLTAFFFTSQNVVNGPTGVWSQRASVFLIPPILLLLLISSRTADGGPKLALAFVSGLLAMLMFVQDFYTAHFAAVFAILIAGIAVRKEIIETLARFWAVLPRNARVALTTALLAGAWAGYAFVYGGVEFRILGARIASHDARRPALVALAAGAVCLWLRRGRIPARLRAPSPWLLACGAGAATGLFVFLWIYLGAFLQHREFPEENLRSALVLRDPSRWHGPLDVVRDLGSYDTMRSFQLVLVMAILAFVPWFRSGSVRRRDCLWFLAISIVVLLVPLSFGPFSVWAVFLAPLPGFAVIRDPKRIVHVYELAVVLATALFLTRLPPRSAYRITTALVLLFLLLTARNREAFDYERPIAVYDRWVGAPIAIDPGCKSFYIAGASEEYMSRSPHMWTLYSLDSVFVSLKYSIPTLNGYSAWFPDGWALHDPQSAGYEARAGHWIEQHGLAGVCALDIDARTMRLRIP